MEGPSAVSGGRFDPGQSLKYLSDFDSQAGGLLHLLIKTQVDGVETSSLPSDLAARLGPHLVGLASELVTNAVELVTERGAEIVDSRCQTEQDPANYGEQGQHHRSEHCDQGPEFCRVSSFVLRVGLPPTHCWVGRVWGVAASSVILARWVCRKRVERQQLLRRTRVIAATRPRPGASTSSARTVWLD